MTPMYGQLKRKSLHKKAWQIFSRYIRFVRDKGICYTCTKRQDPREMDAGHYKHSDVLDINEMNVHCQCVSCNRDLHGNPRVYRQNLVRDYGEKKVVKLERLAKQTMKDAKQDDTYFERAIKKYSELII